MLVFVCMFFILVSLEKVCSNVDKKLGYKGDYVWGQIEENVIRYDSYVFIYCLINHDLKLKGDFITIRDVLVSSGFRPLTQEIYTQHAQQWIIDDKNQITLAMMTIHHVSNVFERDINQT